MRRTVVIAPRDRPPDANADEPEWRGDWPAHAGLRATTAGAAADAALGAAHSPCAPYPALGAAHFAPRAAAVALAGQAV